MRLGLALAIFALVFGGCSCEPRFTPEEIAAAKLGEGLPSGFWLGTATAAHQIEGGNDNDWTDWEQGHFADGTPHIKNEDRSTPGPNSWEQWPEDVAAMRKLGVNAYRLSIEWSRLMPREGEWDAAAARRYRELFLALRKANIEPVVTLFHFTLPRWLANNGGWENPRAPELLADFSARSADAFGDLVDAWVTINEPNVYAVQGYLQGIFPPGVKDGRRQVQVMAALLRGHAASAKALRAHDLVDADGDGKATFIGLAHHVRVFQPAGQSELDTTVAALTDRYFNDAVPEAIKTGRIVLSVPGTIDLDEDAPELLGTLDYLGINYYTRDHVRTDLSDPSLSKQYAPDSRPKNDLGWDLYPEGFYALLVRFSRFGWPLVVTENGIADAKGEVRPDFLRAHLYALQRAVEDGADVRGYLHWSLIDNFEWAEGYSGRFGLFRIDFADPARARVPTQAVPVFQEAARGLGLSPIGP